MSEPTEIAYVVGFMFSLDAMSVALIRKRKPAWQAGLLNGIGGKIEPGETAADAMAREFLEETGSKTDPEVWKHYHTMSGTNDDGGKFRVEYFATIGRTDDLRTVEHEEITVKPLGQLDLRSGGMVENVAWLIALAFDVLTDGRPSFSTSTYGSNG